MLLVVKQIKRSLKSKSRLLRRSKLSSRRRDQLRLSSLSNIRRRSSSPRQSRPQVSEAVKSRRHAKLRATSPKALLDQN